MTQMHSQFDKIHDQYFGEIEYFLTSFLKESSRQTGQGLAEMSLYQFETGGKRLRALIPLYIFEALGRDARELIAFGAAVEMIHNATLVHDDLQDGDELRRHRPTIWKKYSSAQAINCGDAMFQYAFQLMGQLTLEPATLLRLYQRAASATLNVIEGQAQEFIMKDEVYPGFDRYLSVIRGKTSGLFALPVVGALEAAGVSAALCGVVEKAAMALGVLFQIQDDVLDVYGEKGRGQRATDVAEGKVSAFVAYVNDSGSSVDKAELARILKKPREQTTQTDIDRAIEIFERSECKERALGYIRRIQQEIASDKTLKQGLPEVHQALITLGEIFLKPIIEII